jgi:pimeloyl-ACP methyl ester carboxylesterase
LSGSVEAVDMEPAFESVDGWRRIYPDLPGMGDSEVDPTVRDLDGYVRALIDLLSVVAPDGGLAVAGTSAGAALAQAVAHSLRDRIRGLFLRVPMLEPARRQQFGSDAERDALLDAEPRDEWLPRDLAEQAEQKRESLWKPARERAATASALEELRNDPARYAVHVDVSGTLTCPALIIAGRQDLRVGYEDAATAMTQYPRATVAVLDRASHVLPVGDRRLFDALIQDWLHRMDEMWG